MKWKKIRKTIRLLWKYKSLDYKRLDTRARNRWRRERKAQLIAAAGRCAICGRKEKLTIDHIIPISKGGSRQRLDNLQVLCQPCNLKKGDKCPGYIYSI